MFELYTITYHGLIQQYIWIGAGNTLFYPHIDSFRGQRQQTQATRLKYSVAPYNI